MRKDTIRKANLHYDGIDRMPEAGLPIGNGRMGTLLWVSGDAVHMQINRCDVFACDGRSTSFARCDTDYAHGCAFIDIRFPGWEDSFGSDTKQSLDVYCGVAVIQGRDVTLTFRFDMENDVLLAEIDDRRHGASPAEIHLRPLRAGSQYIPGFRPQTNPSLTPGKMSSYVVTGNHIATSNLELGCGQPGLRQLFEEGDYKCESEVKLAVTGRSTAAQYDNFSDLCIKIEPGTGLSNLYVASNSSFSGQKKDCSILLSEASMRNVDLFKKKAASWWEKFWETAPLISMTSRDGVADRVARDVIYFQYICACVSRGEYAARFGGLLFKTNGDYVMWGSMFWWHNQSCYYNALTALGMFDLAAAQLKQISHAGGAYRRAAKQQWGADGMWIPETVWFNGPAEMDEELAEEMRMLYTMQKPWEERSQKFRDAAQGRNTFESRWNWIEHESEHLVEKITDKGVGPFGHVTHIFSTTAKIAWLYWQQYRITMDETWFREVGYPIIRDTATFYATMPQLKKGPDGKLHLYHVNNHESNWDCSDSISEMSAAHGILPIAIRSAEILGADTDLRDKWKDVLKNLAPMVTNKTPGAMGGCNEGDPEMWVCAAEPCMSGRASFYHNDPFVFYDLYTLESPRNPVAENTYRHMLCERYKDAEGTVHVHVLDKICEVAARMGDADAIEKLMIAQLSVRDPSNDFCDNQGSGFTSVLDNRLTLREGPQAIGCQRIGRVTSGLVHAVCSCVPPAPGEDEVLHLFAATPAAWDVEFSLPTRGGLWVKGVHKEGKVQCVEIKASKSGTYAIKNPWTGKTEKLSFSAGETKHLKK